MAAFGLHAFQASVNEPSGARLFSGFWVEIGQSAYDHGAQFELRRNAPRRVHLTTTQQWPE